MPGTDEKLAPDFIPEKCKQHITDSQYYEMQDEMVQMKSILEARDERIDSLETELDEVKDKRAEKVLEVISLEHKIADLEQDIQRYRKNTMEINAENLRLKEDKRTLQEGYDRCKAFIETLQNDISVLIDTMPDSRR